MLYRVTQPDHRVTFHGKKITRTVDGESKVCFSVTKAHFCEQVIRTYSFKVGQSDDLKELEHQLKALCDMVHLRVLSSSSEHDGLVFGGNTLYVAFSGEMYISESNELGKPDMAVVGLLDAFSLLPELMGFENDPEIFELYCKCLKQWHSDSI